ncbi:MAG: hypothetical protein ACT4QF_11645 [Sporichthyaceae bacterium]
MHWSSHLHRLLSVCVYAEAGPGDDAAVLDAISDLIDLQLAVATRSGDRVEANSLEVASLHLGLAREHAMPAGPSAVPTDLPASVAARDACALLDALLSVASPGPACYSRRLHLRAAARALRGEPLLPTQRGRGSSRTV